MVIYRYKPAYGPEPLITNGQYAPAGTAYNDAQYATVLAGTGTANAQLIDFGQVHYVSHVKIQADQNDVYQLDVSSDNSNWVPWYTVPTVSAGGLQTRDSGVLPPTLARYVRVYATSGDGKYSVSEVQVFANPTLPGCNGLPNCSVSVGELVLKQTGALPTAGADDNSRRDFRAGSIRERIAHQHDITRRASGHTRRPQGCPRSGSTTRRSLRSKIPLLHPARP